MKAMALKGIRSGAKLKDTAVKRFAVSQVRTSPFQGDGSGSNPLGGARGLVERFVNLCPSCYPALKRRRRWP